MQGSGTTGRGGDSVTCRLCGRELRAITNTHLVRLHGFDPDHPIRTYKERFRIARAESAETRRRQIRALERTWELQGRRWTEERVLEEIRRRAEGNEPLNAADVRRTRQQLFIAAKKCYGTWDRAVSAAGLKIDRIRKRAAWSREKVLAAIREMHAQGRPLNHSACAARGDGLVQAARRRFGSWDLAIRAAGYAPERIRLARRWTREEVLEEIRGLKAVPPAHEARNSHRSLFEAARRRWGTWERAVGAAGRSCPERARRRWTRREIVLAIRRRADNGESLRAGEVARKSGGLWRASRREFGSWGEAVRAAFPDAVVPDRDVRTVRDLIFFRCARIAAPWALGRGARKAHGGWIREMFVKLREGRLQWSEFTRQEGWPVERKGACAYCGTSRNLGLDHVVPLALRVKPACAGCPRLLQARNQVRACAVCRREKGNLGLYEFFRRRWRGGRKFDDKIPLLPEMKYLKTVYDCHACAGSLEATDADGDGRMTVGDIDSVVARYTQGRGGSLS